MYIGKAGQLRQIVQGVGMGRAYNEYTYVPKSKLAQASSPRVRVNGLLNRAICGGATVSWWWTETTSEAGALRLEAQLISAWQPEWNRALIL
jgi:excinuclease UvrABC nuclease subunit